MINLTSRTAKKRYHALLIQQNKLFEAHMTNKLSPLIKVQYNNAASQIEKNKSSNFKLVNSEKIKNLLKQEYKKIGAWYLEQAQQAIDNNLKLFILYEFKQDIDVDNFWTFYTRWIALQAAENIKAIDKTTKKIIKGILKKSLDDGLSYEEAAKIIRDRSEISSKMRSRRIARTELHTASMEASQLSMENAPIEIKIKEWSTAGDHRVRTVNKYNPWDHTLADAEKVLLDKPYVRTGEKLMYPGDPNGSPGNIINCRCVSLYET